MAQMKLIPADNMKDKLWGRRGTPEREAMETKLKEDVNAYIVGEAIRKARLAQNLTQEQLGEIGTHGTNHIAQVWCFIREHHRQAINRPIEFSIHGIKLDRQIDRRLSESRVALGEDRE